MSVTFILGKISSGIKVFLPILGRLTEPNL
jgi:hypothetical protein